MGQDKLQWTGIDDPFSAVSLPAGQSSPSGNLPDIRDNSFLPQEVRHADRDIFIASYLTSREIETQKVIAKTALRNKGEVSEDAQENYIQVTGSMIGRRDSIADKEHHGLVQAFTQVLVNDAANELYRSMKYGHSLIDRAATTQRRAPEPVKPEEPKAVPAKVIERRKLTLIERLKGEALIEYE